MCYNRIWLWMWIERSLLAEINVTISNLVAISIFSCSFMFTLQWRHNGSDGVSNHRRLDGLLNRLFRCRSKKTSKLCVTGLCEGNSPVTYEFPAQRASDAKDVSIWWRHHEFYDKSSTSVFWEEYKPHICDEVRLVIMSCLACIIEHHPTLFWIFMGSPWNEDRQVRLLVQQILIDSIAFDVGPLWRKHWHVSIFTKLFWQNWESVSQKQLSRAGTSNYIPQYPWDVITCPCPW